MFQYIIMKILNENGNNQYAYYYKRAKELSSPGQLSARLDRFRFLDDLMDRWEMAASR